MADDYQNMLYRELLTKLNAIERENARLKEQLRGLQAIVVDLQNGFRIDSESTTKHIKKLQNSFCEVYDYLFPVVAKVFPGWTTDNKRLSDLLGKNAGTSSK